MDAKDEYAESLRNSYMKLTLGFIIERSMELYNEQMAPA
jgi:hypothetical protein